MNRHECYVKTWWPRAKGHLRDLHHRIRRLGVGGSPWAGHLLELYANLWFVRSCVDDVRWISASMQHMITRITILVKQAETDKQAAQTAPSLRAVFNEHVHVTPHKWVFNAEIYEKTYKWALEAGKYPPTCVFSCDKLPVLCWYAVHEEDEYGTVLESPAGIVIYL